MILIKPRAIWPATSALGQPSTKCETTPTSLLRLCAERKKLPALPDDPIDRERLLLAALIIERDRCHRLLALIAGRL